MSQHPDFWKCNSKTAGFAQPHVSRNKDFLMVRSQIIPLWYFTRENNKTYKGTPMFSHCQLDLSKKVSSPHVKVKIQLYPQAPGRVSWFLRPSLAQSLSGPSAPLQLPQPLRNRGVRIYPAPAWGLAELNLAPAPGRWSAQPSSPPGARDAQTQAASSR